MEEILQPTMEETQQPPQKPDNYLVWSILVTLFCCLPFGIAAIVYSSRVDSEWNAGRYDAAKDAAASAKKWTLIGAGIGAALVLIYVIFIVIMVFAAAAAGSL